MFITVVYINMALFSFLHMAEFKLNFNNDSNVFSLNAYNSHIIVIY